jgi:prophage regulatory protein
MPTFLRYADLKKLGIGYSDQSLRRLEAANQFPKRVKIGERHVAWVKAEIDQYVADRIAARTGSAA